MSYALFVRGRHQRISWMISIVNAGKASPVPRCRELWEVQGSDRLSDAG